VMGDFRKFLNEQNVRYAEPELAENLDWVKRKIKEEVFVSTFGLQEGFKVQLEADPQLIAGIEAVPQARALYENARKIMAQRAGGATYRP
jgi:carboxyl-terminal processing protease